MRPASRAAPLLRLCLQLLAAGCFAAGAGRATAAAGGPPVLVAHLQGEVDPVSARYLQRAVRDAAAQHAAALVITVDTPGGLDPSMRQVAQALLNSPTPSIAYVSPQGARAASAGVFIAEAANVVAMAPATNIGAAHPVASGGGDIQGDLRVKVTNDAAAYLAGVAHQRGRDQAIPWLTDAVEQSVSVGAEEAVRRHVADMVEPNLPALLQAVNGWRVKTAAGELMIRAAGAPLVDVPMNPVEQVFQHIVDPNIAYLLLTIGFWSLLIELFHPGALVPGVSGAICLVLAFVAFAALPINWGGMALILVAIALFVLDVKAAAHGALTLAGLACFVLGSLLLYNPPGPRSPALPQAAVALPLLLAMAGAGLLVAVVVVGAAVRAMHRPALAAFDHMPGALGTSSSALDPRGTVRVEGQLWSARLVQGALPPGRPVRVLARRGLTLEVEPAEPAGLPARTEEERVP